MKNKFYTIVLLTILVSCSNQNPIEETLIANSGEYWTYYTSDWNSYTYYKFKGNHLSYRYGKDNNYKFSEYPTDIMSEPPRKWSVTEDSIMTWNNGKYDVVSYNDKVIVLLYLAKEKPYTTYIFLIKEDEKNPTRGGYDFEEKRLYNPEKYLLQK